MGTEEISEVGAQLANSSKIIIDQSSSPKIGEAALPEPETTLINDLAHTFWFNSMHG